MSKIREFLRDSFASAVGNLWWAIGAAVVLGVGSLIAGGFANRPTVFRGWGDWLPLSGFLALLAFSTVRELRGGAVFKAVTDRLEGIESKMKVASEEEIEAQVTSRFESRWNSEADAEVQRRLDERRHEFVKQVQVEMSLSPILQALPYYVGSWDDTEREASLTVVIFTSSVNNVDIRTKRAHTTTGDPGPIPLRVRFMDGNLVHNVFVLSTPDSVIRVNSRDPQSVHFRAIELPSLQRREYKNGQRADVSAELGIYRCECTLETTPPLSFQAAFEVTARLEE